MENDAMRLDGTLTLGISSEPARLWELLFRSDVGK
jgi:hypothetical protein|tara:strand:- start:937 stop:1041 length:105 start_codon:yes stop_codon:yes gene_type:complete